ncbi:Zuotin [Massospora cicadina]|nr:Zuotin [Massospora cicadina]
MGATLHCQLPSIPGNISAPKKRELELLGPKFQAFVRRRFHNRTHSEDEKIQNDIYGNQDAEAENFSDEEVETPDLARLDPRNWKEQDHYKVLGLSKYRYKATNAKIKAAFHKKVLRHHPDKKAASGNTNDDAFFKCIQKAYEILTDPVKRRQYDSVDDYFPDTFPSAKAKGDFFELWASVFEREARFSNKQPVPSLGDADTPRSEVESFYDFWYNMDSWRSFEYLDKEDTDSDNRDNKRYIDKKNKAERAQRKKEDNARLIKLIDTAISVDPRIQKFKEEDRARRNAKKNAKSNKTQDAEEKARKEEEERLAKLKAEEEAKAAKESSATQKKAREALKKVVRKEKKAIRDLAQNSSIDVEANMQKLEEAFERIGLDMEALGELKSRIQAAISSGSSDGLFE